MKQVIHIVLAILILVSCQNNSEKKDKEQPENAQPVEQKAVISVKDSADYSTRFLEEMEKAEMKNVSLVDSFMILGKTDTVIFPQTPKVGTSTTFTAREGDLAIGLIVERINQTTIEYSIEMVEFGNASFNCKGKADLSPRFYFGSEIDQNSLSGNSYLSAEFIDREDTCYTFIRIGKEKHRLLAKLKKNCNGKHKNIELDNFPILIEK